MRLTDWLTLTRTRTTQTFHPKPKARMRCSLWKPEVLEPRLVLASDFGDARGLAFSQPAEHVIDATQTTLFLGAGVDAENDSWGADEEDGLVDPANDLHLTAGESPTLHVRATNTTGLRGYLCGWIDLDRNGHFEGNERVVVNVTGGVRNRVYQLQFPPVPSDLAPGTAAVVLRLSTDVRGTEPFGRAIGGEVEVYTATIGNVSNGDLSLNEQDGAGPSAEISTVDVGPHVTSAGIVAVTFSEPVTGVSIQDFRLIRDNRLITLPANVLSGSGSTYSLDLTGLTQQYGEYSLTLIAAGSEIKGSAGNYFSQHVTQYWSFHYIPATLTIDRTHITESETATITVTLTDPQTEPAYFSFSDSDAFSHSNSALASFTKKLLVIQPGELSGTTTFLPVQDNAFSAGRQYQVEVGSSVRINGRFFTIDVDEDDPFPVTAIAANGQLHIDSISDGPARIIVTEVRNHNDRLLAYKVSLAIVGPYGGTTWQTLLTVAPKDIAAGIVVNFGDGDDSFHADYNILMPMTINGGAGNDFIYSGIGNDVIDCGDGDDTVIASGGNDTVVGGAGNDRIALWSGNDVADGGTGNDTIEGGDGSDRIDGGVGFDDLYGEDDFTSPDEDGGNDTLNGGDDTDFIFGGPGEDMLLGGRGADYLEDDSGSTIVSDKVAGRVIVTDAGYSEGGYRYRISSLASLQLIGSDGDDYFDASAFTLAPLTIVGGNGNDTIIGSRNADSFWGGEGDDLILGAGGDDRLDGQAGNDTVRGQAGNDSLSGGLGDDRLDAGADANSLIEEADRDLTLSSDPTTRAALFTGLGNDTLVGRFTSAVLTGGESSNRLDAGNFNGTVKLIGLGGADLLIGTAQNDVLDGGVGNDTLSGRSGNDELLGAAGNDELYGGLGADTLTGGRGNDLLDAGAGNDVLTGGDGNDTLLGGLGSDVRYETLNVDAVITGTSITATGLGTDTSTALEGIVLVGGSNANLFDASAASVRVTLIGGAGDDTLIGSAQADVLIGGNRADSTSGTDSLMGNGGVDVLDNDVADTRVDAGADSVVANVFATLPNWIDAL